MESIRSTTNCCEVDRRLGGLQLRGISYSVSQRPFERMILVLSGRLFILLFNCWIVLYDRSIMPGNLLFSSYLLSYSQNLRISLLGVCRMLCQSMLKFMPGTFD